MIITSQRSRRIMLRCDNRLCGRTYHGLGGEVGRVEAELRKRAVKRGWVIWAKRKLGVGREWCSKLCEPEGGEPTDGNAETA